MSANRLLLSVIAMLVIASWAEPAWSSNVKEAIEHLDDAVDAADEASGVCREAIVKKLRDLIADLKDDPDAKVLKDIVADVEVLSKKAQEQDCPAKVLREINAALDDLTKELAARGDVDHKARGRSDCWNANDPACNAKRDEHYSMGREELKALMAAVAKAEDDLERIALCEKTAKTKYASVRQLVKLLALFQKDRARVSAVKAFAAHVVDPDAAHLLMRSFNDDELANAAVESVKQGSESLVGSFRSKIGL
jgi:hypothetical protein